METKFLCYQCEKEEERCYCSKYCYLCEGNTDTRLCEDGLYYCKDCRQGCGYKTQEEK